MMRRGLLAQEAYKIEPIRSDAMDNAISLWQRLERGNPPWADGQDVRTITFGNTIARELAALIAQNIDIKITGGANADKLQDVIDNCFLARAREVLEKMIRLGGVMAKYNGSGIEYIGPDRFVPVETDSMGNIVSVIFFSAYTRAGKYYTRAEWHRYDGDLYRVSNKAYVSDSANDLGRQVQLAKTKWHDIQPEVQIAGLKKPLYAYLKCPYSNTIDPDSPLGVSIFSGCIQELRWLDIAMSTLGTETEDSKPVLFIDSTALRTAKEMNITLPRFVQAVGDSMNVERQTLNQWTPTLQIASRKEGINFYLSIISYKCGFDPGYFVFNGQTISVATATQVEATERRTINTVLSYREILDRPASNGNSRCGFIHDICYIIDAMMAANGDGRRSDYGDYDIYCDFADLTTNEEEDKMFDKILTDAGYMAKWQFLVRHLGMTEQEAKQTVADAAAEQAATMAPGLFSAE